MGQRGKRTDVTAQVAAVVGVVAVGLDHHGHGIPAHVGAQAFFDLYVAGTACFLVRFDSVDVTGGGRERHVNAVFARVFEQLLEQEVGALAAFFFNHGGQGVHPFKGFLAVQILGFLVRIDGGHARSPDVIELMMARVSHSFLIFSNGANQFHIAIFRWQLCQMNTLNSSSDEKHP